MKYFQKNRISNSLLSGLLVLIFLVSVSAAWARDPVPRVTLNTPIIQYNTAAVLPAEYSFPVQARDLDTEGLVPLKYRYLLKEAMVDGVEINSRYGFDQYQDQLVTFDDSGWSEWVYFQLQNEQPPHITLPELDEGVYYIIAVQVLDADGTASMDVEYSQTVVNFRIDGGVYTPQLDVYEEFMGHVNNQAHVDIASSQTLNFSLHADASYYGADISSLRYGWDLVDPDDPNDPGWANPPGVAEEIIIIPEQVYQEGMHSLFARVIDSYGTARDYSCYLNVIPFVSPENQLPLLFIDQVLDSYSGRWPSESGDINYDAQQHRDEYWGFLQGAGGVQDFLWERDHLSDTEMVNYADIVSYKAVMVNARSHFLQLMFQQFRPENGQDKFVWLAPYQAQGGNLFLLGDRSMESFLEVQNYMVPLMFDTQEEYFIMNNNVYIVGFGLHEFPDGSTMNQGARMYPFLTAGLSVLDWSVPLNKNVYGRLLPANQDRTTKCSGLKAMSLSEDFRSHHQIGSEVLSDTLWTNQDIDWRDTELTTLDNEFPFTGDEFVDANITDRPTYWSPQPCADGVNYLCLEPMFQGVARFDWMREKRWAGGDPEWPGSEYSEDDLEDICGEMALGTYDGPGGAILNGTALVSGKTYGYLSYKNVADKPSGKADVYWGFDPYRFDQEESRESVRWVLEYFGLAMHR